jgi:uncharacterized protein (TIGR01777 family)
MKFFFTGGTGFIGNMLVSHLLDKGHEITLLVFPGRKVRNTHRHLTIIEGNPAEPGSWQEQVATHQVIVNLAGASIFQLWNSRAKKAIYDSRILTTRNIVAALSKSTQERRHLFSASGIGYYGYHPAALFNEESPPGDSFLARLAVDWEAEARKACTLGTRVVLCRFGIVLGKGGGALKRSIPLFKLHLGGSWGSGEQWFSWIHERDVIYSFLFLLSHREIDGPVNFTAPNPVHNREMVTAFKKTLNKKSVIPAIPRRLIEGMLGEFSEIFLKGHRALPGKLLQHGYHFRFPTLEDSLENLLNQ